MEMSFQHIGKLLGCGSGMEEYSLNIVAADN